MAETPLQKMMRLLIGTPETEGLNFDDPEMQRQFGGPQSVQYGTPFGGLGALGRGATNLAGRLGSSALRGPVRPAPWGSQAAVGGRASRPAIGTNASPAASGRAEVIGVTRNGRRALPAGTAAQQAALGGGRGASTSAAQSAATNAGRRGLSRGKMVAGGLGLAGAAGGLLETFAPLDDGQQGPPTPTSQRPPSNTGGMRGAGSDQRFQNLQDERRGAGTETPTPDMPNPYDEFMQDYMSQLEGSYDDQIAAIAGLGPLFQQQAAEAQGNITGFFDYAGDVANAGIPVNQQVYDDATGNVDEIYNRLDSSLAGLPSQLTGIASDAAGGGVSGSVAERVATASAPFMAASSTSRANANANLAQSSAAGSNYLNQLASATGAEGAMANSAVEQAMQQQLQLVASRQAELEGAKQRALLEISSDIAGSTSERMANAALSSALGLDLGGDVDPMDFLRGQQLMQGEQVDPIEQARDLIGLEQAQLNLLQDSDPEWDRNQITGGLTAPASRGLRILEGRIPDLFSEGVTRDSDQMMLLLQELDNMVEAGDLETSMDRTLANTAPVEDTAEELRKAIRALYG